MVGRTDLGFVSARTNKRHHHHNRRGLASTDPNNKKTFCKIAPMSRIVARVP
jgi:hypothetical protein